MGGGIAQALASAGYPVHLWDVGETQLSKGVDGIRKRLDRQVEKGRLPREKADGIFARLRPTSRLEELSSRRLGDRGGGGKIGGEAGVVHPPRRGDKGRSGASNQHLFPFGHLHRLRSPAAGEDAGASFFRIRLR